MNHRDLEVYKRSYKLAKEIYKFSLTLPRELQRDIADDIRRASRSIPSNIAEGYGRNKSSKDTVNHLNDSLGSNDEMLFNLDFMHDVDLMKSDEYEYFSSEYTICGKQLFNLIKRLKEKPETRN